LRIQPVQYGSGFQPNGALTTVWLAVKLSGLGSQVLVVTAEAQ
jgi:hypothetical protein